MQTSQGLNIRRVGHSTLQIGRRTSAKNELFLCEPLPAEENELLPLYIEGKWVLQKKLFHEHVNDSVLKFLNGGEQDDIDECDEIFGCISP